jgi:hypothetical protein
MVLSTDIARYLSASVALILKRVASSFRLRYLSSNHGGNYPSKEELMAQFNKNIDAAVKAVRQMTDEQIGKAPTVKMPKALPDYVHNALPGLG